MNSSSLNVEGHFNKQTVKRWMESLKEEWDFNKRI